MKTSNLHIVETSKKFRVMTDAVFISLVQQANYFFLGDGEKKKASRQGCFLFNCLKNENSTLTFKKCNCRTIHSALIKFDAKIGIFNLKSLLIASLIILLYLEFSVKDDDTLQKE